jgi:hypothetical protein
LKSLHHPLQTRARDFKSISGTRIIKLPVPFFFSKFVSEVAATYDELRKEGTGAADLKSMHHLLQTRARDFKSISGTRIIRLLVLLMFPKFACEVAAK